MGDINVRVVEDSDAVGKLAADAVAELVAAKPDAVLSVPTGSTPLPMFEQLVQRVQMGEIDLSRAHVFTLDEYVGMTPDQPNSLSGWLIREFLDPARILTERRHLIPAMAQNLDQAATAYEAELAALGGLDLAVLGLGPNGHIAYNEPGATAESRTRVVQLTPGSVEQAAGYWPGEDPVPSRAITVGIGTLLEARRLVLIVTGESKAEMLKRTVRGSMTNDVPASWLQLAMGKLTVIADKAAASGLT